MTTQPSTLVGTPVVPGVGFGPVVRPAPRPKLPVAVELAEAERAKALEDYNEAVTTVAERLTERANRATGAAAEVLTATAGLAQDRGLQGAVSTQIKAGVDAAHAMQKAAEQFSAMFTQLGGLMAERVTDLFDIRDRVIAELTGQPEPGVPNPATPSVLLADDLAPADTAGLDPAKVLAIGTQLGGPTSHTAIICRQLGIPCVVAVSGLNEVATGTSVLVDGSSGEVVLNPDPDVAEARATEARALLDAVAHWEGPAQTSDGHRVDLLANVQDGKGAAKAAETSPAEGVGLFRTELAFLDADSEPTVEEQATIYSEVLSAFDGKKVVIRTLDAGSDKPLKFANMTEEENPALGVRGLRISLDDSTLLDHQLDAIAKAAKDATYAPWVMAPMVATVAEATYFADKVRQRGLKPGVMIEIPAAALHADRLLKVVEFLSIGTNDLTQYTMAADRLSAELAGLTDPWQPALLQLVSITAAAGKKAGKPVGVCGEAAADPLLACILVGMGITSLSCAAAAVRGVGAQLGTVTLAQCEKAAKKVLAAEDSAAARAVARDMLT
ncbi:MAG: phosphoenolpyruvate--protein phosphotransferase [Actinomycetales bacterium]